MKKGESRRSGAVAGIEWAHVNALNLCARKRKRKDASSHSPTHSDEPTPAPDDQTIPSHPLPRDRETEGGVGALGLRDSDLLLLLRGKRRW